MRGTREGRHQRTECGPGDRPRPLPDHHGRHIRAEGALPRAFHRRRARLGAIAFTEAAGGANFDHPDPSVGVQTFAVRNGDEWVLNGREAYTTNASGWDDSGADLISVVCRVDPSKPPTESLAILVVEAGTPGVEITGVIDTMGHLATNSPVVEFRDVRVPLTNMIGQPGDGMGLVKASFSWTCSSIGAAAVGKMRAAFDFAYEFLKTEKRLGAHPVIEHQNAGYMLADIKTRIEVARYFAWKAADHFDRTCGKDRELSNMVKVYNSELAVQTVYDAMRLVGDGDHRFKDPYHSGAEVGILGEFSEFYPGVDLNGFGVVGQFGHGRAHHVDEVSVGVAIPVSE